jgi:ribose transport system ATP-binding protein
MGPEVASRRAGAGASTPALVLRNLSKTFGGAHALKSVDLTVAAGEVHGLLGQNGSGKSTLIKILSGYHQPEPGAQIEVFGRPMPPVADPGDFRKFGLAFVHQHLGLVPSLSVLENLRIGEFATDPRWAINWRAERERARRTFERYELDIDPGAIVAELPQVTRALLAIVRAMEDIEADQEERGVPGLLVLDEPTPFLPRVGVEQLFDLVRRVVKRGASVIFVTHDVDEVMEITDRATVLRDGVVAGTLTTRDAQRDEFVERIIGSRVVPYHMSPRHLEDRPADVVIEGLSGGTLRDVSLKLHRGEVLGLTGLIGTGFDEVLALLFGARRAAAGTLKVGEHSYAAPAMTPAAAIAAGIAFLPADRLGESGIGGLSVADNAMLPVLDEFMRGGFLSRPAMTARTRELGEVYQVRPNVPGMLLEGLSGGNQQKVLLYKWLQTKPKLLLLDEPTQGVDVGARQKLLMAIGEAAEAGTTVIVASTDYEQLEQICDRVLIFARGEVIRELHGSEISKSRIAEQCYQSMTLTGQSSRTERRYA